MYKFQITQKTPTACNITIENELTSPLQTPSLTLIRGRGKLVQFSKQEGFLNKVTLVMVRIGQNVLLNKGGS